MLHALRYIILFLIGSAATLFASASALGQSLDQTKQLMSQYVDCVKESSAQYLTSNASPGDVADAAQSKCERELAYYQDGVRAHLLSVQSRTTASAVRANQMSRQSASELRDGIRAYIIRLIIEARAKSDKDAQIAGVTPPQQAPKPKQSQKSGKSSGTGFFVSNDGYLITNAHVVDSCVTLNAIDGAGQRVPVRVVRVLKADDLALLKSNTAPKSFAVFRESARINQGEAVVAYGYPLAGLLASGGNVSTGLLRITY